MPLPLIIGSIAAGIALVRWLAAEEKVPASKRKRAKPRPKTAFERRMASLEQALKNHEGRRVLVIGQPGAGKSTLVDEITRHKCRPRPIIGVQTDATDWSGSEEVPLWHLYRRVMIVDSPGFDTQKHPVESFMSFMPFRYFDVIALVIRGKLREADQAKILKLVPRKKSIAHGGKVDLVLLRSCAEELDALERAGIEVDMHRAGLATTIEIMFFSSRTGEGLDRVSKRLLGEHRRSSSSRKPRVQSETH